MGLRQFIEQFGDATQTITVVDPTDDIVKDMLTDLFEDQPVDVVESDEDGAVSNDSVVISREDGSIAASSMESIQNAILFVNSDTYISGARDLDAVDTPEAILGLADTVFTVRGYPDTRKQKFLLIELSRYIESRAWEHGEGELHSSFQYLSRLHDERGTREVYRSLGGTDVDVHLYGVADEPLPDEVDAAVYTEADAGDFTEDLRRSWFVVYTHPSDPSKSAALVCYKLPPDDGETGPWKGFWTFDDEQVAAVREFIVETYH